MIIHSLVVELATNIFHCKDCGWPNSTAFDWLVGSLSFQGTGEFAGAQNWEIPEETVYRSSSASSKASRT